MPWCRRSPRRFPVTPPCVSTRRRWLTRIKPWLASLADRTRWPGPMDLNRQDSPPPIRFIAETLLVTTGSDGADISPTRCTSMEVRTAPATLLYTCRRDLLNIADHL